MKIYISNLVYSQDKIKRVEDDDLNADFYIFKLKKFYYKYLKFRTEKYYKMIT